MKVHTLILGAGPAGLTVANRLLQAGDSSFLVLEKENTAGGLCRSEMVDGSPFDIGGGHFLDVRRPAANRFLFGFMPEEEWNLFNRDSRIRVNGTEIGHPFEANIWQMPIPDQIRYLKSISVAGCNRDEPMPTSFVAWINWKLGDQIAADYMLPYNRKMFSRDLDQLGTYWLEKLPNVSFEETLQSCLERKPYGEQPGHAQFYYPKAFGYGELWRRMAERLGDRLICGSAVAELEPDKHEVRTETASYSADRIVVTIPWTDFVISGDMPEEIREGIGTLRYSSIETRYFEDSMETAAHWIYYPDPELPYHRILVRHNFCPGSRGYWTETNCERADQFGPEDVERQHFRNEYAYPLNTLGKPEAMKELLAWAESKQIYGLGRWGEWQHYNSDLTVEKAINLAERLLRDQVGEGAWCI